MSSAPIIIIGAGPAGLLAAIAVGKQALVLERNPYPGKKLLLSGSGQCNFTNALDNDDFLFHLRSASHFLKPALYAFDKDAFIDLLAREGCGSAKREDGKYFPETKHSASVRDALYQAAVKSGAKFSFDTHVSSVSKQAGGGFAVKTDKTVISADKIILATGGKSYPQTGSDGLGYVIAKSLGHKIEPLTPALASVDLIPASRFTDCAGISLKNVPIAFCSPQGRIKDRGDLLFTHTGLSGPVILNNAFLIKAGSSIAISFVEGGAHKLQDLVLQEPKKSLQTALKAFALPTALIARILGYLAIDGSQQLAQLKSKDRNLLGAYLQNAVFHVKSVESFETAMATAGGIDLADIRIRTMESRICPKLYFAGEILNYHAPTGGFNIQLAASTGWLAGSSAVLPPS